VWEEVNPAVFDWGDDTPGTRALAFSILAHVTDDAQMAHNHHVAFAREVLADLPKNEQWGISAARVAAWLQHASARKE
jgi:hypothetical protein